MVDYKGKIIGEQDVCCEQNRKVIEVIDPDFDDDWGIHLIVVCGICDKRWVEVLD